MAKGIRERLLKQAIKFHQWQEATYPGKTSEELGGEWEVDYPYWNDTYSAFCHVLTQMDAETADSVLLDEMVYLIARANEAEGFIQETTSHPQWFECLCRRAAASNENEAKWQFAAYLPECSCSQKVRDIILDFAKDPNEYVSRRALLAMPALRPDCVEQFAPLFWERNCYSPELQEYQRIAVLISLDAIHSDQLPQYLEQAKQDGRRYLLEHAERIEGESDRFVLGSRKCGRGAHARHLGQRLRYRKERPAGGQPRDERLLGDLERRLPDCRRRGLYLCGT